MSRLATLRFRTLHIPFRHRFSHASAQRTETSSIWVEAMGDDGTTGYGESCPRPYVTGETLDSARDFFHAIHAEVTADIRDACELRAWVNSHASLVDRNPAAWCAIELAVIDFFARQTGQTSEAWLGLPETTGKFHYSAVLGDADVPAFSATFNRYREVGMADFKLKLSGDLRHDRNKMAVLAEAGPSITRLRLDANNLWQHADAARDYLMALAAPAFAVEEPLAVTSRAQLSQLAQALDMAIILDESLCRIEDIEYFSSGTHWIPNLRVSKMGGVLRSLKFIEAAQACGMSIIVGAQVGETSLLSRAALTIARAAGESLIAQEGAFGTLLLEQDVCNPPIMFGKQGMLEFLSRAPGWGIACMPNVVWLRE